jgi:glycosyltransferase involved in cell wall biosynthesis
VSNRSETSDEPSVSRGGSRAAALSIVIPAFNEEDGIAATLEQLEKEVPEAEILVIDDGSQDRTSEVACRFPSVTLVRHPFNRGYGAALKTGMTLATRDYVAWFDADNEHKVSDLLEMLELIERDHLVAVIAERRHPGPSPIRKWGKWLIRSVARTLSARPPRDFNCGLRVFRRDVITRYLPLLPNGFSASVTSTMLLIERQYPFASHMIETNPRIGSSKVRLNDGFFAIMVVLRTIMMFAPMRIFLRFGALLGLGGAAYGLGVWYVNGLGIPASAVLVMLSGVVLILVGLLADQISQIRLAQLDKPYFERVKSGDGS